MLASTAFMYFGKEISCLILLISPTSAEMAAYHHYINENIYFFSLDACYFA